MKRTVEVLDTTFRDGLQGLGMHISVPRAMGLVRLMAKLGFQYLELGFAGSNDFAAQLVQVALREDLGATKAALFGRTRAPGKPISESPDVKAIIDSGVKVAVVVCKARLTDVRNSLRTKAAENLSMIRDTVDHLKQNGLEVILDLEHGMYAYSGRGCYGERMSGDDARRNFDHFHAVISTGADAGASTLVVCDTNGGSTVEEVGAAFNYLTTNFPSVNFGFHGHRDRGYGEANTRAAVLAGARHIQGTLNGFGERCGNTDLISVVPSLQLYDGVRLVADEALTGFTELAHTAWRAFGIEPSKQAPFVSIGAVTTAAGMHSSGLGRDAGSYLSFHPEAVGNIERIVVNKQSGASNVIRLAEKYGLALDTRQAAEFMAEHKAMIDAGGFESSEESFVLACMKFLGNHREFFVIEDWSIVAGTESGKPFAHSRVKVGIPATGTSIERQQRGKGPVDALSKSLHQALSEAYPTLGEVRLGTFDLHALNVTADDTEAKVLITADFYANGKRWVASAVSSNFDEAALQVLIVGLQWFLLQESKK